jgi:hypothetical protein
MSLQDRHGIVADDAHRQSAGGRRVIDFGAIQFGYGCG